MSDDRFLIIKNSVEKWSVIQEFCNEGFKKEIIPTLNRRIIVPFYIPILSIICAFYLIKPHKIFWGLGIINGMVLLILLLKKDQSIIKLIEEST